MGEPEEIIEELKAEIKELNDELEKKEELLDDYRRWVRNCPE